MIRKLVSMPYIPHPVSLTDSAKTPLFKTKNQKWPPTTLVTSCDSMYFLFAHFGVTPNAGSLSWVHQTCMHLHESDPGHDPDAVNLSPAPTTTNNTPDSHYPDARYQLDTHSVRRLSDSYQKTRNHNIRHLGGSHWSNI